MGSGNTKPITRVEPNALKEVGRFGSTGSGLSSTTSRFVATSWLGMVSAYGADGRVDFLLAGSSFDDVGLLRAGTMADVWGAGQTVTEARVRAVVGGLVAEGVGEGWLLGSGTGTSHTGLGLYRIRVAATASYDPPTGRALGEAAWDAMVNALGSPRSPVSADEDNSPTVFMTTGGDRLESVTQAAMRDGADAALVLMANGEPDVFQLRDVTLNPDGSFALTGLLRGRRGTDVLVDGHAAGELFVLLDTDDVETFAVPLGEVGLAASQADRHGPIEPTGNLTAARLATQPGNHWRLALRNATSGGQAVTVGYAGGGATVAVATDSTALLVGDGTDLHGVAGGGPGGGSATLAWLDDVDVAGALSGDLLRFDGALWGPVGSGVLQRAMLPFKGALVRRTSDLRGVSPPPTSAGRPPPTTPTASGTLATPRGSPSPPASPRSG